MEKLIKEIIRREQSFRGMAARARAKGDTITALHYDEIANEMRSLLDLAGAPPKQADHGEE